MDPQNRLALINRYRDGIRVVEAAIEAVGDQLDRAAPGDPWTPRMIVHHLADSEMTSAIRLRRLLAEDEPLIIGYDEVAFARRLHYEERALEASLDAIRAARESTATILDLLSEAEWGRGGTHSESGYYGVETWLEIYATHAHDHAEQIRRAIL